MFIKVQKSFDYRAISSGVILLSLIKPKEKKTQQIRHFSSSIEPCSLEIIFSYVDSYRWAPLLQDITTYLHTSTNCLFHLH